MKADKGQDMQSDKEHSSEFHSSQGNHTPGPWRLVPGMHTVEAHITEGGYARWADVARCPGQYEEGETEANARRIVACVNYCEGVQTLEIENAPKHLRLRDLLDMMDNDMPKQQSHRLVYNKTTKKIDKVGNSDGLVAESFDPPSERP